MLYKWKNVVLQMLLMRLCPSLTADQTSTSSPVPFLYLSCRLFSCRSHPSPPPPITKIGFCSLGLSSYIMFNNLMYQNISNGNSVFIGSVISISYDFLFLQRFYFACFFHFFQLFFVAVLWSDIGIFSHGVSHDST